MMAVPMQTDDFPYLPSGPAEVNKMIQEHADLFSESQCKVCSAVLISESQKLTHYQSKKHANKVRRFLSTQNEKEPAVKKFKSSSSESEDCNNGDTDRSKACRICNMTFSSPVVAESHYQGKVHAKNLRLKAVGPQTPAVASQTPAVGAAAAAPAPSKKKPVDDSSAVAAAVAAAAAAGGAGENNGNPDRFCGICQASFNNPLMAQQHYVGKKHRKQTTKQKLMETYGPSTAPASTLKGYPCTVCSIELNSVEQYQSHISGAKHKNHVKKSGLNTTENPDPVEESFQADVQYAADDNQYVAEEKQYVAEDNQYAAEDNQYAPEDNQYAAEDNQYAAEDNQYAPEDTEYSEENQFT